MLQATAQELGGPGISVASTGGLHSRRMRKAIPLGVDALALLVALIATTAVVQRLRPGVDDAVLWLSLALIPVKLQILANFKLYQQRHVVSKRSEFGRLVSAIGVMALVELAVAQLFALPVTRAFHLLLVVASVVTLGFGRLAVSSWFQRARARGRMVTPVVVIGDDSSLWRYVQKIGSTVSSGYEVVDAINAENLRALLAADDLPAAAQEFATATKARGASGVVLAGGEFPQEITAVLLREFAWAGLFVEVLTGVVGIAPHRTVVRSPGGSLVVVIDPIQQRAQSFLAKRSVDVAVSGFALIVSAPLMLLTAVLIKVTSPGPVLFLQPRLGRHGRVFDCLKFRSMVTDAEAHPFKQDRVDRLGGMGDKTADDPRITKVGRFIRRTSIDELPQLYNVLRGDMSLVGPRPLALDDALVSSWCKLLPYRHRVRPGITCTWQVSGRSRLTESERLDLDLYYVDNWSSWLDTEVAVRTVPAVVKADGAC